VINETLARKYFGNDDPIGHTIKFNIFDELPGGPKDTCFEIIGVVGDFKNVGLQDPLMRDCLVDESAESDQKIREQHQWLFSFHAGLSL
jgi:hypothetical protein